MAKESYICSSCKQTFTRKFNGERHNNIVHNGIAVIFNKKTGRMSNKRDLVTSSNNISARSEIKKPTSKLESYKDSTTDFVLIKQKIL